MSIILGTCPIPWNLWICSVTCQRIEVEDRIKVVNQFSSVQFSHSVVSDSLWPHGPQHTRFPCPSPTPGAYSNSCPLSQWCHPTTSSSVIPFSSCLQSFPASGSFPVTQFFESGSQSIGVSASASVLPMNIQNWFTLGLDWLDLLAVQGTLQNLLQKHQFFWCSALFLVQLSHPYMTTGKTIGLTRWTVWLDGPLLAK